MQIKTCLVLGMKYENDSYSNHIIILPGGDLKISWMGTFSFKIGLQISRARTPTYFVAQSECREEKKRVHLRNQIYKRDWSKWQAVS